MLKRIKPYKWFFVLVMANMCLYGWEPALGLRSMCTSLDSIIQMAVIIPPIFIILGLLDVWIPRETMLKLTGEDSGLKGAAVAFILGSVAAGPLYAAFPIAGVLLKKGCRYFNVLIFIGAWSTTKIPMILFEVSTMGWQFATVRLCLDIAGISLIAYVTDKIITPPEKAAIYKNAGLFE